MLPDKFSRGNSCGVPAEIVTTRTTQDKLLKRSDTIDRFLAYEGSLFSPSIPQISLAFSDAIYNCEQKDHVSENMVSINKTIKSSLSEQHSHKFRRKKKKHDNEDSTGVISNNNNKTKMPRPRTSSFKKTAKKFTLSISPRAGQKEGPFSKRTMTRNRTSGAEASSRRDISKTTKMRSRSFPTSVKVKRESRERMTTSQLESHIANDYIKQRAQDLELEARECWDPTATTPADVISDSCLFPSPRFHWSHERVGAVLISSNMNDLHAPLEEDEDLVIATRSRDFGAVDLSHSSSLTFLPSNSQIQHTMDSQENQPRWTWCTSTVLNVTEIMDVIYQRISGCLR